jgi:hypothetical protein
VLELARAGRGGRRPVVVIALLVGIVYAALIRRPAEIGIYLAISGYCETAIRRRRLSGMGSRSQPRSRGRLPCLAAGSGSGYHRGVDTAYISAIAALSGSIIGGLTSLAASWVSQNAQARTQMLLESKSRRQELYKAFIEEASKLYGDALISAEDHADVSKFAGLYVVLSQMRILSSQAVVENAEKIIKAIAREYFEPNRTLREIYGKSHELDDELDIMRDFSEACREDLKGRGSI